MEYNLATDILPTWISRKKALISPGHFEKDSFKYSIISRFFPDRKHCERVAKYLKQEIFLFYDGNPNILPHAEIDEMKHIRYFEKYNNASVSVLQEGSDKTFIPFYIFKNPKKSHFVLFVHMGVFFQVRSLSRLFGKDGKRKKLVCPFCLVVIKYKKCNCLKIYGEKKTKRILQFRDY